MKKSINHIKELLASHGLKATAQRMVIYNYLLDTYEHPTAEKVYEMVIGTLPTISLATVYKTLDTLAEAGIIRRVSNDGGRMRYDANVHSHNHIHCTNTEEIVDYEDEELKKMIQTFLKKKNINNLKITDFSLHISGEKIDPNKDVTIN